MEALLSYDIDAKTLNAMRVYALRVRNEQTKAEMFVRYARVRDVFTSACSLTTADNIST